MQSIISFLVCVIDVDSVFGKDTKYVTMSALSCNPECIESLFICLVDIDHLVLEHEPNKVLTVSKINPYDLS